MSDESGFTLIEGLVALAVMAAGLAAIGEVTHESFLAGLAGERRLALVSTARKIVTGLPDRAQVRNGDLDGTLDNHRWRLEASSFAAAAGPANASRWAPQSLALHVTGPYGDRLEIDMVRLQRVAGP